MIFSAVPLETLLDVSCILKCFDKPLSVDSSLTSQCVFDLPVNNNSAALRDSAVVYRAGQYVKSTEIICCAVSFRLNIFPIVALGRSCTNIIKINLW